MKLILHIIRKDFQHLRSRLGMWVAILGAKYALGFWLVLGANIAEETFGQIQGGMVAFVGADIALTLLLTALLVQADGLVGSTQFWLTRPIAGVRLLVAKFLGAALLLIVPAVMLAIPWWWVCGFDAWQISLAALDVVAVQAFLILCAMSVACLTETVVRFFLWLIVLSAVLGGTVALWAFAAWDNTPAIASRIAVHAVVIVATLAVIIAVQYLTRRRLWALAILPLSAGAGALVLAHWPWNIFGVPAASAPIGAVNPALAPNLTVEMDRRPQLYQLASPPRAGDLPVLIMQFSAQGIPEHVVPGHGEIAHTWSWPDGWTFSETTLLRGRPQTTLRVHQLAGGRETPNDAETTAWLRTQRGTHQGWWPGFELPVAEGLSSRVSLPVATAARLKDSPAAYRASLTLELIRPELWLEVPVARSRWQAAHGRGIRVMNRFRGSDFTAAHTIESEPVLLLDELRRQLRRPPLRNTPHVLVTANRERGETHLWSGGATAFWINLGGARLRGRTIDVTGPRIVRGAKVMPANPEWAGGASVAIVGLPTLGAVKRELFVPRFDPVK